MYAGFHPDSWWEVDPEHDEECGEIIEEETTGDLS